MIVFDSFSPNCIFKDSNAIAYFSNASNNDAAISGPNPCSSNFVTSGAFLIDEFIYLLSFEHLGTKESGVPLPAVHAFNRNGISMLLWHRDGVSTPQYNEPARAISRYVFSVEFLNGDKYTKKYRHCKDKLSNKSKNFFPMVWYYAINAFIGNHSPMPWIVYHMPDHINMMNIDVAENENIVFVYFWMFNFYHPRCVLRCKKILYMMWIQRFAFLYFILFHSVMSEELKNSFYIHFWLQSY